MEEIITDTIDNGVIENVQIAPIGEYIGSDAKGNPVPEKIDADSLQKIADGLNETETEVLADVDHGASKPGVDKETKAAGWFHKFIVDPLRGLFATLKLTKHGKELLENREYRYISPTFKLDENGKPVELATASLTNMPAFKGYIDPILNTEPNTETITMELTREELVELIKQTIADLKKEEKVAELDKAIENENECHENIVENLEQEKQDVEAGVVQNSEPSKTECQNECGDDKKTEVKNAEESDKSEVTEEVKEEVKEEIQEGKEEGKTEEEIKEEVKEEIVEEKEEESDDSKDEKKEKKEEVIKIEALNSAPTALKDVSGKDKWMNLHGKDFWDYLAKHPEIKG